MTWRVIVGTLSLLITMIVLGYVAVTEQDRMNNFALAYDARQVETGALLFEANCATCHGLDGTGTGRAPALDTPDLFVGSPPPRLAAAGWGGTVEDYVESTIAGGRPRATVDFAQYPERMPTWSQEFGGSLRTDQIKSLTAFVMNWGLDYEGSELPEPTPAVEGVGTDITAELPAGDAARGEEIAVSPGGCTACHISTGGAATLGPDWMASGDPDGQGIGTRAELRLEAADYAGTATSGDQYLFESIVQPDAYIVPGNASYAPAGQSIMPHNYGTTLSAQQVADIIAYLQTIE
jgi:mono/diheme cytochrome c family protein